MKTIPPKALARFQELTDIVEITLRYDSFDYPSIYSNDEVKEIQRYRINRIKNLVYSLVDELEIHSKREFK